MFNMFVRPQGCTQCEKWVVTNRNVIILLNQKIHSALKALIMPVILQQTSQHSKSIELPGTSEILQPQDICCPCPVGNPALLQCPQKDVKCAVLSLSLVCLIISIQTLLPKVIAKIVTRMCFFKKPSNNQMLHHFLFLCSRAYRVVLCCFGDFSPPTLRPSTANYADKGKE